MTLLKSYLMNTTNPFVLTRIYYDEVLMKAKDSYKEYISREPFIVDATNEIESWKMKITNTEDAIHDIEDELDDTKKIIDGFSPKEITAPRKIIERREKARKEVKGLYIPEWLNKLNAGDKIPLPAGWEIKNNNEVWENINYRKKGKTGERLEPKWKRHDNVQVIPREKPDVSAFGEMETIEGEEPFDDESAWYIQMRAGSVKTTKPPLTYAIRDFEPVLEEEFDYWKNWLKDLEDTLKIFNKKIKIEKDILKRMEKELDEAIDAFFENIKSQPKDKPSKKDRLKIISILEKSIKYRIKQYKEYNKGMGIKYITPKALNILSEELDKNIKGGLTSKEWREVYAEHNKNKREALASIDFKDRVEIDYTTDIKSLEGHLKKLTQQKADIKSGKVSPHGGEHFAESKENIFNSEKFIKMLIQRLASEKEKGKKRPIKFGKEINKLLVDYVNNNKEKLEGKPLKGKFFPASLKLIEANLTSKDKQLKEFFKQTKVKDAPLKPISLISTKYLESLEPYIKNKQLIDRLEEAFSELKVENRGKWDEYAKIHIKQGLKDRPDLPTAEGGTVKLKPGKKSKFWEKTGGEISELGDQWTAITNLAKLKEIFRDAPKGIEPALVNRIKGSIDNELERLTWTAKQSKKETQSPKGVTFREDKKPVISIKKHYSKLQKELKNIVRLIKHNQIKHYRVNIDKHIVGQFSKNELKNFTKLKKRIDSVKSHDERGELIELMSGIKKILQEEHNEETILDIIFRTMTKGLEFDYEPEQIADMTDSIVEGLKDISEEGIGSMSIGNTLIETTDRQHAKSIFESIQERAEELKEFRKSGDIERESITKGIIDDLLKDNLNKITIYLYEIQPQSKRRKMLNNFKNLVKEFLDKDLPNIKEAEKPLTRVQKDNIIEKIHNALSGDIDTLKIGDQEITLDDEFKSPNLESFDNPLTGRRENDVPLSKVHAILGLPMDRLTKSKKFIRIFYEVFSDPDSTPKQLEKSWNNAFTHKKRYKSEHHSELEDVADVEDVREEELQEFEEGRGIEEGEKGDKRTTDERIGDKAEQERVEREAEFERDYSEKEDEI